MNRYKVVQCSLHGWPQLWHFPALSVCLCNPTVDFYHDLLHIISSRTHDTLVLLPGSLPGAASPARVRDCPADNCKWYWDERKRVLLVALVKWWAWPSQRQTFPSLPNDVVTINWLDEKTKTVAAEREMQWADCLLSFCCQDWWGRGF